MKRLLIILCCVFMFGCDDWIKAMKAEEAYRETKRVEVDSPLNFKVELLFTIDGNKIYKFYEGGYEHYFMIGNGKVLNTRIKHSSGKSNIYIDDAPIVE